MSMDKKKQWHAPAKDSPTPVLILYNSLTDSKVPFVPSGELGPRVVSWYTCGPTVYASAHLGHARNYLTFDIVRRVLEDHFQYSIRYIMNITDVEDKIILRARRNYLMDSYRADNHTFEQVLSDSREALEQARERQNAKVEKAEEVLEAANSVDADQIAGQKAARQAAELATQLAQERLLLSQLDSSSQALEKASSSGSVDALLSVAGDALAGWLDAKSGSTVADPSIFRAHAARYEAEFLEDMETLGVRPPTVLTRVSEYMPEIVAYIQEIESQGFAYTVQGSVYFDTRAFRESGHTYGKLAPWSVDSTALSGEPSDDGKRHPSDFALWKAQKPGEPAWPSPWGPGRPGWHIECSAMASDLAGSKLDIHTGGEDLKFPHHDNELAQAEARFHACRCHQWVNYFLHSGHLGIDGLKMSKSLKNFVSIREALQQMTARQMRLMFVLQPWERPMSYGDQVLNEARAREKSILAFFSNIDVAMREAAAAAAAAGGSLAERWEDEEKALEVALEECSTQVHASLCDNINTRGAMDALSAVIKAFNLYISARGPGSALPAQRNLLRAVADYVRVTLAKFGLTGFDAGVTGEGTTQTDETPALLDALAAFRDEIRSLAKSGATSGALLAPCDRLRDGPLVELGVQLEDRSDGPAVWKRADPEELKAEVARRTEAAREAAARKKALKVASLRRDVEKYEALAALPSVQESLADKYSQFDPVSGDPTHDAGGQPLESKALAKAKKEIEKAKKVRAPLERELAKDPEFLHSLRQKLQVELELGEENGTL